jgi:RecB family endonuclease NucS
MRLLVAGCEIAYHGRATTRLGAGDRVILFKDDGSLCVHAGKGFKPLNYKSAKARELGRQTRDASTSESRSAIMTVGMWGNPEMASGMIDASMTVRPSVP